MMMTCIIGLLGRWNFFMLLPRQTGRRRHDVLTHLFVVCCNHTCEVHDILTTIERIDFYANRHNCMVHGAGTWNGQLWGSPQCQKSRSQAADNFGRFSVLTLFTFIAVTHVTNKRTNVGKWLPHYLVCRWHINLVAICNSFATPFAQMWSRTCMARHVN